ncbi:MAG: hypothetical protein GY835_28180, partial [bacterium]|nr:hypothetical protein [bacterium]
AGQIFDAQTAIAAGANAITDDVDFYADLREQVRNFQGPDSEVAGFVQDLIDAHNLLKSQQRVSIESPVSVDATDGNQIDMQPLMDTLIRHVNETDYSGIKAATISENLNVVLAGALERAGEMIPADAFDAMVETVTEMTAASLRSAEVAPVSADFGFFAMLRDYAKSVSDDAEQQMTAAKFSEEEMAAAREKTAQELQAYIDSMMTARTAFNAAGLNVSALTAEFAEMAGGAAQLAEKASLFSEKFASTEDKGAAATAESLHNLNTAIWELGLNIPETRDGFAQLTRELDLHDAAQAAVFDTMLMSAGVFDTFYTSIEALSTVALSPVQRQELETDDAISAVSRIFDGIGRAVPASRAEFALLADSIDLSTQSGRAMA